MDTHKGANVGLFLMYGGLGSVPGSYSKTPVGCRLTVLSPAQNVRSHTSHADPVKVHTVDSINQSADRRH